MSGRMSFGALRIACGRARAIRRTQGAWVRPAAAKPRRVLCRPFPTASAREGTGGMKRMRIAPSPGDSAGQARAATIASTDRHRHSAQMGMRPATPCADVVQLTARGGSGFRPCPPSQGLAGRQKAAPAGATARRQHKRGRLARELAICAIWHNIAALMPYGEAMRIETIQTAPPPFEPSSVITDEEAGAMLRAAVNLFGLWKLTDKQAAILLDAPIDPMRAGKPTERQAHGRAT